MFNHPYDFRQIDENTYEIIQDKEDDTIGSYRLTVKFTSIDNKWKMADRTKE